MRETVSRCCPVLTGLVVLAASVLTGAAPLWAYAPGDAPRGLRPLPQSKGDFDEPEPLPPKLEPIVPRTGADEARLDAMAWYGTGRMLQSRGDSAGALRSYRKALERDPTASVVYRAAIPLAVSLRELEDAAKWAARAVELLPDDFELLTQAAAALLGRDDLPGAIHVLEQAVKAKGLNKTSQQYVMLMRDLGVMYLAAERKDDAVTCFEVVFDGLVNPEKYGIPPAAHDRLRRNEATSYERLGQIFLEGKKTDLALQAYQMALKGRGGPSAGNLSFNLAQVYLQADKPEQALGEVQKYIDAQRQAKGRAAYELLDEILKKLGKSNELVSRLEAAAAADPRNSVLQYFLADQYLAAGRLADAETLYKKTLDGASDAAGYLGLAGVYRQQGKPAQLLDSLARGYREARNLDGMKTEFKAIVADDNLLNALLETGDRQLAATPPTLDFATGYVLANLAADAKRTATAEKLYRYLLDVRKEQAGTLYEELAAHFFSIRKYAEAAKVYQEAVDNPQVSDMRPQLLVMLARARSLGGDTKGAVEAIRHALELVGENPVLRLEEASVYYFSHQYDEAIEKFQKLLADYPQPQFRTMMRRAQYSLSNAYVMKGEMRKGEEILEEIYKQSPDDVSVNNDLGYLYADQGKNLEQAEGMIKKAVTAEPENAAYLDSMGWVLFKLGKYQEALPYLEKAVKISTGSGDETLWDHLGDVHDRLGQTAKAVTAWRKGLELAKEATYPDQKLIDRLEEKLKNQKQDEGTLKPARPGAP